jgi:exopolysaccharide production protein ExoQ
MSHMIASTVMRSYSRQSIKSAKGDCVQAPNPVRHYVVTWLLMLPLLNMVAKGALSFLSPIASASRYQNGYLLNTQQGVRLPVVINLLLLAGFALAGNREVWRALYRERLIVIGLLLAAASSLWSESPTITLRMSVELTLSTLFAVYLSSRMSTERLMRLLMLLGIVAAGLSVALALFVPRYGLFQGYGGGAWQGICTHKNALGLGMAFLLTPVFFLSLRPVYKISYFVLLLSIIVMSQSRGAWFETFGMFVFVAWLSLFRRLRPKERWLLVVVSFVVAAASIAIGVSYFAPITRMLGKDPTLTGRTGIYALVLESIMKQPFLGYGFAAFWGGLNRESINIGLSINWISIGYAENGFLEIWLQLGIVGLGLVLTMFGRAIKQGVQLIGSPFYNPRVGWFCTLIVLQLLTNVESGWLMVAHTIDWTLTLVAFIGLANEMSRMQSAVVLEATDGLPNANQLSKSGVEIAISTCLNLRSR